MPDFSRWTALVIVAGIAPACGDESPDSTTDASTNSGGRDGGRDGASMDSRDSGATEGAAGGAPDGGADAGPRVSELIWVESPTSVLAGTLEFETSVPAAAAVVVTDGTSSLVVPVKPGDRTAHTVRVLGLHASTRYTATVTVRDAGGNRTSRDVAFETSALPADFPPLEADARAPSRVQPGWTLFPVFRWSPALDPTWGYLVAVDEAGAPVWYQPAKRPGDARVLPSGNVLYNEGDDAAVEIDPAGKEVSRWAGADLGIDTVHHEIFPMPGGTFATLGTEIRLISGYPAPPGAFDVVGDLAVEFERSGTVVRRYGLLDRLDPLRTRPGFDAPFWDAHYGKPTKDWTHANAIIHDPSDDSFIVSLRHQDYLVKLDRKTGALVWRFGEGGDFALESGSFPYHPHAPELGADGRLIVYDNGNGRPNAQPPFTRVVEYTLGTAAADAGAAEGGTSPRYTARMVWEYRGEAPYFAQFVGDVDRLANGNVLVADGGLVADTALALTDPSNLKFGRILEVTHTETPEVLFQLTVRDAAERDAVGYTIYRAERIAPLK